MSKMILEKGYEFVTKNGKKVRVINREKGSGNSSTDLITCEFLEPPFDRNGNTVKITRMASQVLKGIITNPYEPSAKGVGFTGDEIYDKTDPRVQQLRDKWYAIINRVGVDEHYSNVTVCDEWKDFSKFYQWCISQIGWQCYSLDKDLLQQDKSDKTYSPNTCVFVPQCINVCVNQKEDNNDTPLGVGIVRAEGRVEVTIPIMTVDGKSKNFRLGRFQNDDQGLVEAFIHSKIAREQKLQTLAHILRSNGLISQNSYTAILNYRYTSNKVNMDIVNKILRPENYHNDVKWFLFTHHDFDLKLNEMINKLNDIPLNKLSKLAE